MLTCKACGADLSNGKVIEGISKKNGKPYKMVKCQCGNAEFLPFGNGEKKPQPQKFEGTEKAPNGIAELKSIINKLADIDARLVSLTERVKVIDSKISDLNTIKKAANAVSGNVQNVESPEDIAWEE